jgi:heat shock protein HslJ
MIRRGFGRGFNHLSLLLGLGLGLQACTVAGMPPDATAVHASELYGKAWKLVRLGDADVAADATQRQAYLVLQQQDSRVSGSLGCNAVNGSYTLSGEHLAFGALRSTRMACLKGMEVEHGLSEALGASAGWKLAGGRLELYDASGKLLARFEPGAMP